MKSVLKYSKGKSVNYFIGTHKECENQKKILEKQGYICQYE